MVEITKVAVSEFALVSSELCRKSQNIDHARSDRGSDKEIQFYSFQ
jgi:hypothetical protein